MTADDTISSLFYAISYFPGFDEFFWFSFYGMIQNVFLKKKNFEEKKYENKMNLDSSSWMSILKKHARIKGELFLYRKYASKPPHPHPANSNIPSPLRIFFSLFRTKKGNRVVKKLYACLML